MIDSRRASRCIPARGSRPGTVVHGLLHQVRGLRGVGGELRPGIVHRINKDTSGCLVVAKSEQALRALQAQFKSRRVRSGTARWCMGAAGCGRDRCAAVAASGGPEALYFARRGGRQAPRALPSWRGSRRRRGWTWAVLDGADAPDSARTSQTSGWPLFCDKLYGGTRREGPKAPACGARCGGRARRQGLHAFRLAFEHPVSGARVACEAPLPADLRAALRVLGLSGVGPRPVGPRGPGPGSGPGLGFAFYPVLGSGTWSQTRNDSLNLDLDMDLDREPRMRRAPQTGYVLAAVNHHLPLLLARARALLGLSGGPPDELSKAELRKAAGAVLALHEGLVGDRALAKPSTPTRALTWAPTCSGGGRRRTRARRPRCGSRRCRRSRASSTWALVRGPRRWLLSTCWAETRVCFDAGEAALSEARELGIAHTTRELPAGEFDLTLAANVLLEVPDPAALVRKLGGIVVILEPALRETGRALLRASRRAARFRRVPRARALPHAEAVPRARHCARVVHRRSSLGPSAILQAARRRHGPARRRDAVVRAAHPHPRADCCAARGCLARRRRGAAGEGQAPRLGVQRRGPHRGGAARQAGRAGKRAADAAAPRRPGAGCAASSRAATAFASDPARPSRSSDDAHRGHLRADGVRQDRARGRAGRRARRGDRLGRLAAMLSRPRRRNGQAHRGRARACGASPAGCGRSRGAARRGAIREARRRGDCGGGRPREAGHRGRRDRLVDSRADPRAGGGAGRIAGAAEELRRRPVSDLYARLQLVDQVAAQRILPNDRVRIERALEVHALSGQRLSDLQAEHAFAEARSGASRARRRTRCSTTSPTTS